MSVLTISLGDAASLEIKVPMKGETNWSETFKTEFAQKLVEHDHSSGKGVRIPNEGLVSTTGVEAVDTNVIRDGAVTTAKIDNTAITADKIANGAVETLKIDDGAVNAFKLATNAVTSDKILQNAVTSVKIDSQAVTEDKIATDAVTTTKIADDSVTSAKIVENAVTSSELLSSTTNSAQRAVTGDHIQSLSIDQNHISARAIIGQHLSITGGDPVTLAKLANVDSTSPTDGQVLLYSTGTASWGPSSLATAIGVVDTISTPAEASAYSGTAQFIYITSSTDVTFVNKSFVNRTIFVQQNINVTFQGGTFWRSVIKASGFDTTKFIHFKNDTSSSIAIEDSDIMTANSIKLEDSLSASTGLFMTNCKLQAEGILEVDPDQRNLSLDSCSIQCGTLKEDSGTANKIHLTGGTKIDCGSLYGNIACSNGVISSSNGISGQGTSSIEGMTGYAFYTGNSAYAHALTITKDGINTKVVVGTQATTSQAMTGAETDVAFGTELFDPTSSFSSSQFTAKVAGYYRVSSTLFLQNNTGDWAELRLYKNTTEYSRNYHVKGSLAINNVHISDLIFLEPGDVVKLTLAAGDTSFNVLGGNESRFYIEKIN